MTARAQQKAQTHDKIVDAALQLCAASGFAAMRTADVARAVGLSHGAVFVHFPTRDALIVAVAGKIGSEITLRVHDLASRGASLRHVLRAHVRALAEREDQYRWLVIEVVTMPAAVRTAWTELQSAVSFHIGQAADREMAADLVRRVPLHLLFNTWIGLVHHYLVHRDLFAPGRSVLKEHGDMLVRHYMSLLTTGKRG